MKNYFDINPLPLVDDEPEVPEVYFVSTCFGVTIASFDNYDDAVDLICMIEEFCESRGLVRNESLLYELYDLNSVCAECSSRHDVNVCNECSTFRRLVFIRSVLEKE